MKYPALLALILCTANVVRAEGDAENYWPQWRGPLGTGVAPKATPPLTWSETNHVKWKLAVPGEGDATPIVWANRVFVLSAVPAGEDPGNASQGSRKAYRFTVFCVDRDTGKILWQKVAKETTPHEGRQENNTFASASPVTDGKMVWAYFGSRGIHCYDDVLGREGSCAVLKKGAKSEVLATNKLEDSRSDSSIALAGKDLLLRTAHHLYCISDSD